MAEGRDTALDEQCQKHAAALEDKGRQRAAADAQHASRPDRKRRPALNEQASSADSARQAIKLFPFRCRVAHFEGERCARVCAAMGKPRVVIACQESVDDMPPRDAAEQGSGGIVDENHFLIGIDDEEFPLMAGCNENRKSHE